MKSPAEIMRDISVTQSTHTEYHKTEASARTRRAQFYSARRTARAQAQRNLIKAEVASGASREQAQLDAENLPFEWDSYILRTARTTLTTDAGKVARYRLTIAPELEPATISIFTKPEPDHPTWIEIPNPASEDYLALAEEYPDAATENGNFIDARIWRDFIELHPEYNPTGEQP